MSVWGTGILKGMWISIRNMFRGPITVQYPKEKLVLPERARWAVEMKLDEEGQHKCTACLACEKACPDFIIDINTVTDEERNKHINYWRYEVGACMMCGLCVEACPFDAIQMSHRYELATTSPEDLVTDLLHDTPAAKPKRKAAEPKPAAAAAPGAAEPKPAAPAEPTTSAAPTEPAAPSPAEPAPTAPAEGGASDE